MNQRHVNTGFVVGVIADLVRKSSQKQIAKEIGVSPQHLCDVLKGRREPGPDVCAWLGYERVPNLYRKIRR